MTLVKLYELGVINDETTIVIQDLRSLSVIGAGTYAQDSVRKYTDELLGYFAWYENNTCDIGFTDKNLHTR